MASGERFNLDLQPIRTSDNPHTLNIWKIDNDLTWYRVEVPHNSDCCTPPSDCKDKIMIKFNNTNLENKRAICGCGQEVEVSIAAVRVVLGRNKLRRRLEAL